MFQDKTLICRDCGSEFVFSSGEQEFYAEKGFQNEPVRCKACRDSKKVSRGSNGGGEREMFDATCASCGTNCRVPFQPKDDRPVFCSDCFQSRR